MGQGERLRICPREKRGSHTRPRTDPESELRAYQRQQRSESYHTPLPQQGRDGSYHRRQVYPLRQIAISFSECYSPCAVQAHSLQEHHSVQKEYSSTRRKPMPVLWKHGSTHNDRPHHSEIPRRTRHLGEACCCLHEVQQPERGPNPREGRSEIIVRTAQTVVYHVYHSFNHDRRRTLETVSVHGLKNNTLFSTDPVC